MDNLRMARQGSSYTEGDVSFAWGFGDSAVREVIRNPLGERSGRIRARIAAGFIEETNDAVTVTPPRPGRGIPVVLSAIPEDGQSVVFNSDTRQFDPAPRVQNVTAIDLPENATAADIAAAFNDLRVVLIEANLMEPDPS